MKKKLPSLYKGKIKSNSINQKQSIFSLLKKEEIKEEKQVQEEKNVETQIKDIFHSPNYVYKADVSIELKDGNIIKKTIIGRSNNSLITMDDELIDVRNIVKIDFFN